MNNLDFYNAMAEVPKTAQKTISGGKLNGKTDINPMWRIKKLTETFGPVGFGWYTEITDRWVETAAGESAAWVTINLFIKHPETGEWSKPIVGTGGSKQNGKGMGDGINDEAFKMAETDAISVACKKLGMGASIYWDKDKTKYSGASESADKKNADKPAGTASASAPAPAQKKKPLIQDGNPLWNKAIEYCVNNGRNASDLLSMYEISANDAKKLQEIVDFQRELNK
mgnify:CR=1 FL=1